jgi:hypothetical protein
MFWFIARSVLVFGKKKKVRSASRESKAEGDGSGF